MSEKVEVPYDALLRETVAALPSPGLLLVSQGADGKPNAMTIGWGTIGPVWSRPMFVVLVRPSRYTHKLLEENGDFTVCVMPEEMRGAVAHCGTASGRDEDKFATQGLTSEPSLQCATPIIGESLIAYECRTVLTTEVVPERLDGAIQNSAYASGDFHTIYFGKILTVRADRSLVS